MSTWETLGIRTRVLPTGLDTDLAHGPMGACLGPVSMKPPFSRVHPLMGFVPLGGPPCEEGLCPRALLPPHGVSWGMFLPPPTGGTRIV